MTTETGIKELDQLSRKELRELRVRIAELEDTEQYRMIRERQIADESFADHNGDRNAALRLCALKVAAMIGEGME